MNKKVFLYFIADTTSTLYVFQPLRQRSLNKQIEASDVEINLRKAIEGVKQEINETNQLIDNVSVTEANLDAKIERRKVEIDRFEKRLQSLKKVR